MSLLMPWRSFDGANELCSTLQSPSSSASHVPIHPAQTTIRTTRGRTTTAMGTTSERMVRSSVLLRGLTRRAAFQAGRPQ